MGEAIENKQVDGYWYYPVLSRDVVAPAYVDGIDGLIVTVTSDDTWTVFTLDGGATRRKRPSTAVFARQANSSRPLRYRTLVENLRGGIYNIGNYVSADKIDGTYYEIYRHFDGTLLYKAAIDCLALEVTVGQSGMLLALVEPSGAIQLASVKMMRPPYRTLIEAVTSHA